MDGQHTYGKDIAFNAAILKTAAVDAFRKLNPKQLVRNPVMFIVAIGAALTTSLMVRDMFTGSITAFNIQIVLWLWFTVLFANFAEAVAEGRGRAQADALRSGRSGIMAKKITGSKIDVIQAADLKKGDLVVCEAGDTIPSDGIVVEGIASVDESAITGESAPVIRESGDDRSAVTGGTRVLSDRITVRITVEKGDSFVDRIISLVEGASRRKTPNEIALVVLLSALSVVFMLVVMTLPVFLEYSYRVSGSASNYSVPMLVSLVVCLIPTTIGGLLSAIGISGMDRLVRKNVIATSGKAVEIAGDIDVLLLDKTGTITLGNRVATRFYPTSGIAAETLADAAQLSSIADETPEGRSIVVLAKEKYGLRGRDMTSLRTSFVPFSASTRMSGVDIHGRGDTPLRRIRKGSLDAIESFLSTQGGEMPSDTRRMAEDVALRGSTPLVVCDNLSVLGVIELKDVVKGGIRERFAELRAMGIKTIMVTGDNPLTAAAIAAEAGVDEFIAEAKPEDKLNCIKKEQAEGRMVGMIGDGTNDAPALAQADVGIAMNNGTQAAREAGNMVDLDSNPTKLIEVVETGKQLLITRGALTTFSIANDVAKYFAIIPAMTMTLYGMTGGNGPLAVLNIMRLATPESAVLSAVIFNAIILILLIPLSLRGVRYRPLGASAILRRNLFLYGVGGLLAPFAGIKLIDMLITFFNMV